ncbi:DUF998 domain-containing protein [Vulcanisaeta thermophila]|uniref:DUF998 domain-containing protein n=1 Tax=Vulcanisaeta thermophila TaxID=867917 RepID=UPI000852D578|nr:DUF998 domain-containing protein [Vulcanisaeta thermophila]
MDRARISGLLIFIGVSEFLLLMLISEVLYPGYSVHTNYISDLGVGPTALIFNSSIVVMGVMLIIASILLARLSKYLMVTLLLTGIGAAGVGIFNEHLHPYHLIFALMAFLFSSISSYTAYPLSKAPGRYLWVVLGTMGLIALALFIMGVYLGLGPGGMERMIVYPNMIWALGFSGELMRG